MPVWLVTGGSGFLGRHMLALLSTAAPGDVEIVAIGRRCPRGWPASAFHSVDLLNAEALRATVAQVRPSVVFHLAGKTPPAPPEQFFQVNTRGTSDLVAALRNLEQPVRLIVADTASSNGCANSYGLSKWFATKAALEAGSPIEPVIGKVFNPIGPGMPRTLAFGRFAARLAEPGPDPVWLAVGDLDARRDFIDARDVASAFLAIARSGRAGRVYEVGTGESRRVGEGLERLIGLSGRAVVLETGRRGKGPRDSRADIASLVDDTGWTPAFPWEQSLADLWDEAQGAGAVALTPWPSAV